MAGRCSRLLWRETRRVIATGVDDALSSTLLVSHSYPVLSFGRIFSTSRQDEVTGSIAGKPSPPSAEGWEAAMDRGDWESAWDIFLGHFEKERDTIPSFQSALDWNPEEAEREIRRMQELDIQESVARSRTRQASEQGIAHGVGKRKTSVARVWIREGNGHMMVNKQPYDMYFPDMVRRNDIITPLVVAQCLGRFDIMALVEGGGSMGQSQAMRHGIAKALQNWDPNLRDPLKSAGLLTRDARIVERKKPGKKKARKSFQWVKR